MTSNQVANAANMINQQAVDESSRHNQAVEEETNRHNLVTEDLSKRQLEIEDEKRYWDTWYKQESLAIQKEYNDKYLEWQQAQGEQKLEIERQLADIETRKQQADEQFKYWTEFYQNEQLELDQAKLDELERSNMENESIQWAKEKNEEWRNFLTNKSLEYQNSYWNASIALGNLKAQNDLLISSRNYDLGLLQLEVEQQRLLLQGHELENKIRLNSAQQFNYYLNGLGSLFGNAAGTAFKLWSFGGL